jgi:hypothetical protein
MNNGHVSAIIMQILKKTVKKFKNGYIPMSYSYSE